MGIGRNAGYSLVILMLLLALGVSLEATMNCAVHPWWGASWAFCNIIWAQKAIEIQRDIGHWPTAFASQTSSGIPTIILAASVVIIVGTLCFGLALVRQINSC